MTKKLTLKLVLLTLLGSSISCSQKPKPEKKGVGYNSYTEQVIENHRLYRERIQTFADSIQYYQDTAAFFNNLHPILLGLDEFIVKNGELKPLTRKDSLVFSMAQRLTSNYSNIVLKDFNELFSLYVADSLDANEIPIADSIVRHYLKEDKEAIKYFNLYNNDSTMQLKPMH